jgi:SAM-dependent methyltransferase
MLRRSCPVPTTRRETWPASIRASATAPIGRYLSRQAARPHGPFGRVLGRIWLRETAAVNDVALDLLAPAPGERIGEIGFGPGRTLGLLAAAGAEVVGVEVSPTMLAAATRRNAGPVADGTMALHQGDGTTLPWPDDDLDAVLSVHTFHFWPDPAATLADIARVLRPGGRLVLTSLADDHPLPARFDTDIYRVSSLADATAQFR